MELLRIIYSCYAPHTYCAADFFKGLIIQYNAVLSHNDPFYIHGMLSTDQSAIGHKLSAKYGMKDMFK